MAVVGIAPYGSAAVRLRSVAPVSAIAQPGIPHRRGYGRRVKPIKAGYFAVDAKPGGLADAVDRQAQHLAAISMQGERRVDSGGDQRPASREYRRGRDDHLAERGHDGRVIAEKLDADIGADTAGMVLMLIRVECFLYRHGDSLSL